MVETYNAHDQGEAVKKWLQDNGSAIVMGLVIAFGGLFGFKQWQSWQENNRQQASAEFQVMGALLATDQIDAAMDNFQTLKDEHARSPYTSMAALQMARARLELKQPDLAIDHLKYAIREQRDEDRFLFLLGLVYLEKGDEKRSLRYLNRAESAARSDSRKSVYSSKIKRLQASSG